MLDETTKFLEKVNTKKQSSIIKNNNRKVLFMKVKNNIMKVVFTTAIFFILFFPKQSGTIIGTWINDFFITTYKNIIK